MTTHLLSPLDIGLAKCTCGFSAGNLMALLDHVNAAMHEIDSQIEREVYTIPVAFDVKGVDRGEASKRLADLLAGNDALKHDELFECWWMPNDPGADGSDTDQPRLLWSNTVPTPQPIDWFLMRDAMRGMLADGFNRGITRTSWLMELKDRYESFTKAKTP